MIAVELSSSRIRSNKYLSKLVGVCLAWSTSGSRCLLLPVAFVVLSPLLFVDAVLTVLKPWSVPLISLLSLPGLTAPVPAS